MTEYTRLMTRTEYARGRANQRAAQIAARWRRPHWRDVPRADRYQNDDMWGLLSLLALLVTAVCAFLVGFGVL